MKLLLDTHVFLLMKYPAKILPATNLDYSCAE
jgi:hypothetical protein